MSGDTGSTYIGPSGCSHSCLQPHLTPHPWPKEPSSPPLPSCHCGPPPLDVSKAGSVHPQSHGWERFGKALAGAGCDTFHQPPSYLVSLRPAPEECASPVPTAAAGEGWPRWFPPRAVVPPAATLVPREPQPQPSILISTLGMANASTSRWGRGPDERLLGTCHHQRGLKQDK